MCRQKINSSKNDNVFRNHPVQMEQNKPIGGQIHNTKKIKIKTKQIANHRTSFVL